MAVPATALTRTLTRRFSRQVRPIPIVATLAASGLLMVGAVHLPSFAPAGADLADPLERAYAANLWGQVQVSLLLIGGFLPWLIYALLFTGAARGAILLGIVAFAGTVLGTWTTLITVATYAGLPRPVTGVVSRVEGRTIRLASPPTAYYLALSDSELAAAGRSLKLGSSVLLWVSPRGQVGAIGPADVR
ncbi:MAG: hypothetical protein ABI401_09570 [Candidatus Dormibacter sp.]